MGWGQDTSQVAWVSDGVGRVFEACVEGWGKRQSPGLGPMPKVAGCAERDFGILAGVLGGPEDMGVPATNQCEIWCFLYDWRV